MKKVIWSLTAVLCVLMVVFFAVPVLYLAVKFPEVRQFCSAMVGVSFFVWMACESWMRR